MEADVSYSNKPWTQKHKPGAHAHLSVRGLAPFSNPSEPKNQEEPISICSSWHSLCFIGTQVSWSSAHHSNAFPAFFLFQFSFFSPTPDKVRDEGNKLELRWMSERARACEPASTKAQGRRGREGGKKDCKIN